MSFRYPSFVSHTRGSTAADINLAIYTRFGSMATRN
jgi:hypothetical protein